MYFVLQKIVTNTLSDNADYKVLFFGLMYVAYLVLVNIRFV